MPYIQKKDSDRDNKQCQTVLTNLQRGNTESKIESEFSLNFFERTAQGEITLDEADKSKLMKDSMQFTPLHWACFYGQLNAAELLIKAGADVNSLGQDYISCLLLAASNGFSELTKILLQNGAKINHMDIQGNTALMFASALNHPHTCNELIKFKPDITLRNEDGKSAYSFAIENNSFLAQKVLEDYLVVLLNKQ